MNIKNLDFEGKKKLTISAIAVLCVILVLCLIILLIASISNNIPGEINFTTGLDRSELTEYVASHEQSLRGPLALVNSTHEYQFPSKEPGDEGSELIKFNDYRLNNGGKGIYELGGEIYIHTSAVQNTHKMLMKMSENGTTYLIAIAYRSYDAQAALTSSPFKAGHSDHHTGFAFQLKRSGTPLSEGDYQWIAENAHKYGFIQRYPNGMQEYTGIEDDYYTECLHYVGVAHASLIKQKNLCLETYIEYLKKNAQDEPAHVKCDNGEEYYVYYYEAGSKQTDILVPTDAEKYPYDISGTNDGGVVVTIKVK